MAFRHTTTQPAESKSIAAGFFFVILSPPCLCISLPPPPRTPPPLSMFLLYSSPGRNIVLCRDILQTMTTPLSLSCARCQFLLHTSSLFCVVPGHHLALTLSAIPIPHPPTRDFVILRPTLRKHTFVISRRPGVAGVRGGSGRVGGRGVMAPLDACRSWPGTPPPPEPPHPLLALPPYCLDSF